LGEIQNCSGNGFGVFFGSGTFEEELVIWSIEIEIGSSFLSNYLKTINSQSFTHVHVFKNYKLLYWLKSFMPQ
jgi:hypothetical protein